MKNILKNKLFAASLMFLLLNLAGAFVVMAPLLVLLRNRFDRSLMAESLWPVISPLALADTLINDTQMLATFVVAAIVILALYMLLRTFFSGGIYGIIIFDKQDEQVTGVSPMREFLGRSSAVWPGFIKASLFSIVVYLIAVFIGAIIGRLAVPLGVFMQVAVVVFFLMLASTYIQILKAGLVLDGDSSLTSAMRTTRPIIAQSIWRLVTGNLAVVVVGILLAFILWKILVVIRGFGWNAVTAGLSILLEQMIVFVICLMQVVRINFNNSIIKRGKDDVVGGTKLGGV
jgi:hypothetical protein